MEVQTLCEYLGVIDPDLLLQNLSNINPQVNKAGIDELRDGFANLRKQGKLLIVCVEDEYGWQGDPTTTKPVSKRFKRLVIEFA